MLNLCNNSDQTWFCYSLTFARSLGKLKTSGFALGFQHFPRDLANVNEWKIMFDPSNRSWHQCRSCRTVRTMGTIRTWTMKTTHDRQRGESELCLRWWIMGTWTCLCTILQLSWLWKWQLSGEKIWHFLYFYSKRRSWVQTHNLCFRAKIRKIICIPANYFFCKIGIWGCFNYTGVLVCCILSLLEGY